MILISSIASACTIVLWSWGKYCGWALPKFQICEPYKCCFKPETWEMVCHTEISNWTLFQTLHALGKEIPYSDEAGEQKNNIRLLCGVWTGFIFSHTRHERAHFRAGEFGKPQWPEEIRTKNLPKKILQKHLGGAILFNILCINYK